MKIQSLAEAGSERFKRHQWISVVTPEQPESRELINDLAKSGILKEENHQSSAAKRTARLKMKKISTAAEETQ